jgi:hypothetical protein
LHTVSHRESLPDPAQGSPPVTPTACRP